jgi:hypothetical protein
MRGITALIKPRNALVHPKRSHRAKIARTSMPARTEALMLALTFVELVLSGCSATAECTTSAGAATPSRRDAAPFRGREERLAPELLSSPTHHSWPRGTSGPPGASSA